MMYIVRNNEMIREVRRDVVVVLCGDIEAMALGYCSVYPCRFSNINIYTDRYTLHTHIYIIYIYVIMCCKVSIYRARLICKVKGRNGIA